MKHPPDLDLPPLGMSMEAGYKTANHPFDAPGAAHPSRWRKAQDGALADLAGFEPAP